MNYSKKYNIENKEAIGDYEYGYVQTFKNQAFFAIADGWEAICGVSKGKLGVPWVLVKKPYTKEDLVKDRFEIMDL